MAAVLVFTACGGGGGGSGNRPGSDPGRKAVVFSYIEEYGTQYKLEWGIIYDATYAIVSPQFTAGGYTLTSAGTNAGYLTGSDATTVFGIIRDGYYGYFDDGDEETGTFEELVNQSQQGIGVPQTLKTAVIKEKDDGNLPIGAVFEITIR